MRFQKPKSDNSKPAFPGKMSAADGHTSTCAAEAMASEAILVPSCITFAEMAITGFFFVHESMTEKSELFDRAWQWQIDNPF